MYPDGISRSCFLPELYDLRYYTIPACPEQEKAVCFAVPCFAAGRFMDGVMDGIQAKLLGFLGQVGLALGGAVLGFHTDFQVFLGAGGDDLAQEFREPGGVIRFLKRSGLPVFGYSRQYVFKRITA